MRLIKLFIHILESLVARPEEIIGMGMIALGLSTAIFPPYLAIMAAAGGKPTALSYAILIAILNGAFGMRMMFRILSDDEMKLLCSPIALDALWLWLIFLNKPELFYNSPMVPILCTILGGFVLWWIKSPFRTRSA